MIATLLSVLITDIEGLVRNCDYPALQQDPLRLIMFPNSSSDTKEEEIIWDIMCFQITFENVPSAFFRQVCLENGTQVGFAMWTLERSGLPVLSGEKEKTVKPSAKPAKLPRSLDVENWRKVSGKLRAERERVLVDRKNILRK